ncbi:SDH1 [Symbiodinium necroappetens]|uniref:SDH1 protein n=1 Tax=Symbiodinium necroappetens TaxID=1628268 RepID=A0A813B2Z3_9DINO|nr:SDH1 [Symbiodinium necroappetens]
MGLGRGDPQEDPGHAISWGIVTASSLRGPCTTQEVFEASQAGRTEAAREVARRRFGETEKQRGEREVHEGQAFFASCGVEQLRPSSRFGQTGGGSRPYGVVSQRPRTTPSRDLELCSPSSSRTHLRYSNPCLSRVMDQDRQQNGGFFTGSVLAARKVTSR